MNQYRDLSSRSVQRIGQIEDDTVLPPSSDSTIKSATQNPADLIECKRNNIMGPYLRRIFRIGEDSEDPIVSADALPEVYDEQQQDELIDRLMRIEIAKNEEYCKIIWLITALPIPFFLVRLYWVGFSYIDVSCAISLGLSLYTTPVPKTYEFGLVRLGSTWRRIQRFNLLFSILMWIYVWSGFGSTDYYWSGIQTGRWFTETEAAVVLPMVLALISLIGTNVMESVNFKDLDENRYVLKGA
ncbi:hypothetical protein EDC01DRAFT_498880 [Geopyxis carbonaria]|nr:hypothetical protein EDC01DRAFT_498880 [Geopyxis carbonaria]